jgi:hypothetical protein
MEGRKMMGIVLLVIGLMVLALSLLADPIGIGGVSGIGPDQILGAVVGAIAAVVGLILTREK